MTPEDRGGGGGGGVTSSAGPALADNSTTGGAGSPPSLVDAVLIGGSVSVVIVGIVVGNAFVVASVAAFREMRTLTNWMIVSLASADLLVAVAVLPLSAYQVRAFLFNLFTSPSPHRKVNFIMFIRSEYNRIYLNQIKWSIAKFRNTQTHID